MTIPLPGRLACAVLLALSLCPAVPASAGAAGAGTLLVTNSDTGRTWTLGLAGVSGLTLRFLHSYDRRWVAESFKVEKGRLVPSSVVYNEDSYDYRDQRYRARVSIGPDGVKLSDIRPAPTDRFRRIIYRVAFTKSQILELHRAGGTETHAFVEWGRPGQRLVLSLR